MFFANLCEKLFCLEYIMGQGELLFLTFFKAMFSGFKKNVHGLNILYHLENKILVSHTTFTQYNFSCDCGNSDTQIGRGLHRT